MTNRIHVGTILIEEGTHLPESLVVGTHPCSRGWSCIIGSTSAQLDKEIDSAGWTFFYMAGEIQTGGFGFNDQSGMDHAIAHLIKAVKLQHCNCLEITQMRRRSFLGLHYTSLGAHARHIQKSRAFHDPSEVSASARPVPREALHNQTTAIRTKALITGEAAQTWENEGGATAESVLPELAL